MEEEEDRFDDRCWRTPHQIRRGLYVDPRCIQHLSRIQQPASGNRDKEVTYGSLGDVLEGGRRVLDFPVEHGGFEHGLEPRRVRHFFPRGLFGLERRDGVISPECRPHVGIDCVGVPGESAASVRASVRCAWCGTGATRRTGEGGVEASDVNEEADLAIVHGKFGVGDEFAADILGRLEAREDRFEKELVKVDIDRRSRGRFLCACVRA